MADNTILPGTGQEIATDDIGNVKYQRVKLVHGADGENDGDVSSVNGFPVNVLASTTVGTEQVILTQEHQIHEILVQVLHELRIMNAYNAMAHNGQVEDHDITED